MIEEFKPDVIWSTYPIATAHVIASKLHRKTGIPWVADFRDPMAQDAVPPNPVARKMFRDIDADAATNARLCIFTTPSTSRRKFHGLPVTLGTTWLDLPKELAARCTSAAQRYQQRYPKASERMVVLENGYDEESFASVNAVKSAVANPTKGLRPLIMLHSGIIYPSERDPTHLFAALGRLKKEHALTPSDLRLRFRSSVHDDLLHSLAQTHGVQGLIELCPAIPYRDALAEMLSVDALLVMQGSGCNAQIPAKIYEYLRAGKPILGLTDPAGDTAGVLRQAGLNAIARLDSADEIANALTVLVSHLRQGNCILPQPQFVQQASRQGRSQTLAALLLQAVRQA